MIRVLIVDGQAEVRRGLRMRLDIEPDVAIVVFGEDPYAEFVGDRSSVDYRPERPLEIVRSLHEDGIPVVSVFLSGRPLRKTAAMGRSTSSRERRYSATMAAFRLVARVARMALELMERP